MHPLHTVRKVQYRMLVFLCMYDALKCHEEKYFYCTGYNWVIHPQTTLPSLMQKLHPVFIFYNSLLTLHYVY